MATAEGTSAGSARGCQGHEVDAVWKRVSQVGRGLEGQACLAGPARSGECQQLLPWLPEQVHDLGDFSLTSKKAGWLPGKFAGSTFHRLEWRKALREVWVKELIDQLRFPETAEFVSAMTAQG